MTTKRKTCALSKSRQQLTEFLGKARAILGDLSVKHASPQSTEFYKSRILSGRIPVSESLALGLSPS